MRASVKRAIFVASQKGGVGKSTWARAFLECARRNGYRIAAFDCDGGVGQLLQYYGSRDSDGQLKRMQDPFDGVGYFDVRVDSERDILLDAAELQAETALFDLPGGSIGELNKILGDTLAMFTAYRAAGYQVVWVMVLDHLLAATRIVSESIRAYGKEIEYVAVLNTAFADRSEFEIFDGLVSDGTPQFGAASRALAEVGGHTITMPRLQAGTYAQLDMRSLRFSDVGGLALAHRLRVARFLEQFEVSLAGSGLYEARA